MSNIIHISDTHMNHHKLKLGDLNANDIIIHSGDFCEINFLNPDNEYLTFRQALDFCDWFGSLKGHKILTSGNHEVFLNNPEFRQEFENELKKNNILFLDDLTKIYEVEGVKVCGAGLYPQISPLMTQKWAYQNGSWMAQIPSEPIDFFICHAPPVIDGEDDQFTCPEIRYLIEDRIKDGLPFKKVFCGHIHELKGDYQIGQTSVSVAFDGSSGSKIIRI